MKKVLNQMEATICFMISSLSFSGVVTQNFLNDEFILIMTSIKLVEVQKSLLTPYLVPTLKLKVSGILGSLKNKKARFFIKIELLKWARKDLNLRPADYE